MYVFLNLALQYKAGYGELNVSKWVSTNKRVTSLCPFIKYCIWIVNYIVVTYMKDLLYAFNNPSA